MLTKKKSYHILFLLLLGGMMSFNSCLSCKNASIKAPQSHKHHHEDGTLGQPNEKPTEKHLVDTKNELMKPSAKWKNLTNHALSRWIEEGKISLGDKDEVERNPIQAAIHNGITPDELKAFLQKLKQQFSDQKVADQKMAEVLNTPDNSSNKPDDSSRKNTAFVDAVQKAGEKRDSKYIMELVNILLENGARPSPEEVKRTLLYCIKLSGLETDETHSGTELFERLIEKFQGNNTPLDQATALAIVRAVAQAENDGLMQYILEHPEIFPISPTSKDEKGNTLWHYAASGGKSSACIIGLLLAKWNTFVDYIDQPNEEGKMPLHLAVEQAELSTVRALIKAGANIHLETKEGKTPLGLVNDLISQQLENNRLLAIKKILQSAGA